MNGDVMVTHNGDDNKNVVCIQLYALELDWSSGWLRICVCLHLAETVFSRSGFVVGVN